VTLQRLWITSPVILMTHSAALDHLAAILIELLAALDH
jgi:hypothetical protein